MPFILIQGTFHVVGYSPDADSLKFKATDPSTWKKISGKPKMNKKEHVQLRFEAIDAPETHYRPKIKNAPEEHQPLAKEATEVMLGLAGIKKVRWGPKGKKVGSAEDGVAGYILTRMVDTYRRPVAFVYAGNTAEADGKEVHLDVSKLKRSINYKLMEAGWVYPTYYKTLFSDLRNQFTQAVKKARSGGKGFWPKDKTSGLIFDNKKSVTEVHPIFPKLFRRLMEHLAKGGNLGNFRDFLSEKGDPLWILPEAHYTSALDKVVEVKGKKMRMKELPENLVFEPK